MTITSSAKPAKASPALLEATGLCKNFSRTRLSDRLLRRETPSIRALDDVSLTVAAGDSIGIVGESGSGKSTLARTMVRLVNPDAGKVAFRGENVHELRRDSLEAFRRSVQLIYQDPYSSLNPALTVGTAIGEPALIHGLVARRDLDQRIGELMSQVGLGEDLASRRPVALSGGQRQRVAIARALSLKPEILIADEAVSALDVSVQAQILQLFARLKAELGLTLVFVSHQLATVAQLCERVAIMYHGEIVESGQTSDVFANPRNRYTETLLEAHPGQGRIRQRATST